MGEYDDIVAGVRRTTESAVRESQERVDLAARRGEQADRDAIQASQAAGTRWANRINAMRRRAADRVQGTELTLGHEDGPHPHDHTEADDLVSLTEPAPVDDRTPPFGISGDLLAGPPMQPPPPSIRPRPPVYDDDDEDYSDQSWLRDR